MKHIDIKKYLSVRVFGCLIIVKKLVSWNCDLWLGRNEPARLKEYFLTLVYLPFKREEYKLERSGNPGLVSGRGYLLILPPP